MDQKRIQEQIEACRPQSDDLQQAELNELRAAMEEDAALRDRFEKIQRADAAIGQAMRDVSPPAALVARLLAAADRADAEASVDSANRLSSRASMEGSSSEAAQVERSGLAGLKNAFTGEFSSDSGDRPQRAMRSRRQWLVAALASAGAVAAAVALLMWPATAEDLTSEQVAGMARQWIGQLSRDGWRSEMSRVLADFPRDPAVRLRPQAWQRLERPLGADDGVAYLEVLPDQTRSLLFVIPSAEPGRLSPVPPKMPDSRTGGWSIGAWSSRGMVYALAVEGDARRYQSLLHSRSNLAARITPPIRRSS